MLSMRVSVYDQMDPFLKSTNLLYSLKSEAHSFRCKPDMHWLLPCAPPSLSKANDNTTTNKKNFPGLTALEI